MPIRVSDAPSLHLQKIAFQTRFRGRRRAGIGGSAAGVYQYESWLGKRCTSSTKKISGERSHSATERLLLNQTGALLRLGLKKFAFLMVSSSDYFFLFWTQRTFQFSTCPMARTTFCSTRTRTDERWMTSSKGMRWPFHGFLFSLIMDTFDMLGCSN